MTVARVEIRYNVTAVTAHQKKVLWRAGLRLAFVAAALVAGHAAWSWHEMRSLLAVRDRLELGVAWPAWPSPTENGAPRLLAAHELWTRYTKRHPEGLITGDDPIQRSYWVQEDWDEAAKHCRALVPYFEELAIASRFPTCVFYEHHEAGLDLTLGPSWGAYLTAANVLALRNELHVGKSDQAEMTSECVGTLLRLARTCHLPGQMGSGVSETLYRRALECLRSSLTRGQPDAQRIVEDLAEELVRVSERRGPRAHVLRQEAALGMWWMESCASGNEESIGAMRASWWWRPLLHREARMFLLKMENAIGRCGADAETAAEVASLYCKCLEERDTPLFRSFLVGRAKSFHDFAHTVALARLARAGLAVTVYRDRRGVWPARLEVAYRGPSTDPFSGTRFIYQRSASSARVSVGSSPLDREDLPAWQWDR
jgi:hypothetical protein